jgi:hypothetical protein
VSLPRYALASRPAPTGEGHQAWDPLRHRWVALTPEEFVRQHLIQYLLQAKAYPPGLLAVERQLSYGERSKRFDLLGFDRRAQPLLLAECKAPDVALDGATLAQLATYNSRFWAPWLLVTNGDYVFVYQRQAGDYRPYEAELPAFEALLEGAASA